MQLSHREQVDQLIKYFWLNGYLTVSRKFGIYLPDPQPVGNYEIDAIGKYKKKFVIGIILTEEDLNNRETITKIDYLATRQTRYSNKKVALFVGVPADSFAKAKFLIEGLSPDACKNIKVVSIDENISTLNSQYKWNLSAPKFS